MADAKAEFDALYKQATTEDESRLVPVIDRLKILGKQLGMHGIYKETALQGCDPTSPQQRRRDGLKQGGLEHMGRHRQSGSVFRSLQGRNVFRRTPEPRQ